MVGKQTYQAETGGPRLNSEEFKPNISAHFPLIHPLLCNYLWGSSLPGPGPVSKFLEAVKGEVKPSSRGFWALCVFGSE